MRPPQPREILRGILDVLKQNRRLAKGDAWTPLRRPLFQCLRSGGKRAGFSVWDNKTAEGKQAGGEYLWDITWTHESDRAYWMELAGEIELNANDESEVLDDFYKVLDAMARLKVFVAGLPWSRTYRGVRKEIEQRVRARRLNLADEWLLVVLLDWRGRQQKFVVQSRAFRLSSRAFHGRWRTERFGW